LVTTPVEVTVAFSLLQLCHVWFHADYVAHNYLSFSKSCIDGACKDTSNRFDDEFAIEVYMEKLDADDFGIEPELVAASKVLPDSPTRAPTDGEFDRGMAVSPVVMSPKDGSSVVFSTAPRSHTGAATLFLSHPPSL
jgi:hypothetical protein